MGKIITKVPMIPKLPTRTRVAAYARVSDGKDAMLRSLAAQVSHYSSYIQGHPGWEYVGVYADEATTGTKDSRPEFQRLLADCRAGRIDLVLTKSISRFARNTVTLLQTVRELKGLGIDIYFEEQNIHSMSGEGELMLSILACYAQEESRSVSENCKWRIRKDFEKGKATFFRVYGYRRENGELIIEPEEARVVRRIYGRYLAGMGWQSIANQLSRQGIPAPQGMEWNATTVKGILRNEKYIGEMLLQKKYVTDHITKKLLPNRGVLPQYHVQNSHPPIIDKMTFEEAHRERERRWAQCTPPRNAPIKRPFSGLIRCEKCGAPYMHKTNNYGTKYAKSLWTCSTYNRQGKAVCDARQIPEDILTTLTTDVLGWSFFDADEVRRQVREIRIVGRRLIVFVLADGKTVEQDWDIPSRKNSWTDEMKQRAREQALLVAKGE
ncbi:MAG: recombinase family protein [Candidatus Limiplasma sp.]|nr:recombinase family protein [Candidatus Limiplasma sp.]